MLMLYVGTRGWMLWVGGYYRAVDGDMEGANRSGWPYPRSQQNHGPDFNVKDPRTNQQGRTDLCNAFKVRRNIGRSQKNDVNVTQVLNLVFFLNYNVKCEGCDLVFFYDNQVQQYNVQGMLEWNVCETTAAAEASRCAYVSVDFKVPCRK